MVDYKKWDKFAQLDSDGEEEDPQQRIPGASSSREGPVRVTRLDKPSTVTIGAKGGVHIAGAAQSEAVSSNKRRGDAGLDYSKWDKMEVSDSDEGDEDEGDEDEEGPVPGDAAMADAARSTAAGASASASASSAADAAPAKQQVALEERLSRNGGASERMLWSQDPREVVVAAVVAAGTRAKAVRVALLPAPASAPRAAPAAAPAAGGQQLAVSVNGVSVLQGTLAYPVAEPEAGEELEWEVVDFPARAARLVKVTLAKQFGSQDLPALPRSEAVVVWWKRVFTGDAPIDVAKIPDRAASSATSAQAWAEAHRLFKERVQNQEPVEL